MASGAASRPREAVFAKRASRQRSSENGRVCTCEIAPAKPRIATHVSDCTEHTSLKQEYDDAMSAWQLHRLLVRADSLSGDGRLRRELLAARHQASERLYHHSRHCTICRP